MTEFGTPQHFLEIEKLCQDKDAEIDRLRAENERLADETTQAAKRNLDLRVENDRLRAENAELRETLRDTLQFVPTGYLDTQRKARAILAKTAKEGE